MSKYLVFRTYKLKPDADEQEFKAFLHELSAVVRSLPGCLSFMVLKGYKGEGEVAKADYDYAHITLWESPKIQMDDLRGGISEPIREQFERLVDRTAAEGYTMLSE